MDVVGSSKKIAIDRNAILGEGSNGTCVYKGTFEKTVPVAVKRMIYIRTTDLTEISNEVATLRKLDHPNIIRYKMFDKDKDFLYIVLDLCDTSLTDCLRSGKFLPMNSFSATTKFKVGIMKDVLNGLRYLHRMDVIHRDLKPQNVLIKRSISTEHGIVAVITDFGLSLEMKEDKTHVTATEAGSKGWKPREVLGKGKKFFKKSVDIFAFGCIAQFVLSKADGPENLVHPFGKEVCRERNIVKCQRVAHLCKPAATSGKEGEKKEEKKKDEKHSEINLLGDIMVSMCINDNPKNRPDAEELLNHPIFWSYTSKLHFVEKIFNDLKDKPESDIVKSLEGNWKKYQPTSVEKEIPEAWGYSVFCRKKAGQSKPTTKLLFHGLLRNVRNIQQHCKEATRRYTEPHKHENSEEETRLQDVLGDGSDEDIGKYYFSRIPSLIPIVYLSLYLHARETKDFQYYYNNSEMSAEVAGGKVKAGWDTLEKLLISWRSPRSAVPTGSANRHRSSSFKKSD